MTSVHYNTDHKNTHSFNIDGSPSSTDVWKEEYNLKKNPRAWTEQLKVTYYAKLTLDLINLWPMFMKFFV